ncbi:MAG: hypothetical protein ACPGRC_02590 [Salibacteraceae bacterium]
MNVIKKLTVLTTLIFTGLTLFSQNSRPDGLEIVIGEEIKLKKKELVDQIIGKDEGGTYVMAKYGTQMTIYYYSNKLSLKKKATFKLEHDKKDLSYRGMVQMSDDIIMFTTYRDKKKKMTYLYSHKLNKSTLMFSKPKTIASASYEGYKKRESAYYSFKVSSDSNYLLFITDLPTGKEDVDRFGMVVYDRDMEEVWGHKNIEIDESNSGFYRYSSQVGNDGQVYLLAKIFDTSRKYKKGEINYTFEMQVYSEESEEPDVFDVGLDGRHMSDLTFERLDNGNFNVIGFFSDEGGVQNGVFNISIDGETYEVVNESVKEFPTDFIVQHSSEKQKKKAKKKEAKGKEVAFYSYDIDELIEHKDGSVTMIGEQYRYYQTCYTDANGNTRCTNHYIYGNIIIVKYDADGDVAWMELIPKYQHTTNDGGYYSGYALTKLPDGSFNLLFNDNPKNSYYEESGKFYGWKRTSSKTDIVLYTVQEEGRIDRYVLLKGDDEEVMSRPQVSVQIDSNETVVLGQNGKSTKLFKLIFE